MADVRGMYALGQSLNTAADTVGNLPVLSPDGLKQTAIAAATQKAKNDLYGAQQSDTDRQIEQNWQQEAQGRDDFGTEDYAKDYAKFLQEGGASPAKITAAQMAAQQAAHQGQMTDMAQQFVYGQVTDRIAQKLGMQYYGQELADKQKDLVAHGMTAQQAADYMAKAAIERGKEFMTEQGIAVNVDHNTGKILAMDKEGNSVPIDPDIAASAYKMIGHPVPWNTLKDIQNESLLTGKALGTTAYGGAPGTAAGAVGAAAASPFPGMTPAQALTLSKNAEAMYRSVQMEQIKEANKASAAVTAAGGTEAEADAAHDKVMKRIQPIVDQHKAEVAELHRIISRSPKAQLDAAGITPAAAATPVTASSIVDKTVGAPVGPPAPAAVSPANLPAAAAAAAQNDPAALAQQGAELVRQLHLDRNTLNTPHVQAFLQTLPPGVGAAIMELLSHAAQVYSPRVSSFPEPSDMWGAGPITNVQLPQLPQPSIGPTGTAPSVPDLLRR